MPENFTGNERRQFLRYRHEGPVNFKIVRASKRENLPSDTISAFSKNLSASGILFSCPCILNIGDTILLSLDYRTSLICREIEDHILMSEGKLLGKIVRVEATDDKRYDIGVAFIKKSEPVPKAIKKLLE